MLMFGSPFFLNYAGLYVEVRHGLGSVMVTFVDKRTQNRYASFSYTSKDSQNGLFNFDELHDQIDRYLLKEGQVNASQFSEL
jgi:hypothetical protein